ncbi:MAG: exo-beta-N-acetylmuramidase NamZ domain-containing protein [Syntrophothermus sp.]
MARKNPCASGIDVLLRTKGKALKGLSIAILTNPTGVTRDLAPTVDALAMLPGVKLRALFGPEHGIRGHVQDAVPVPSSVDPRTGIPVYSLYDDHLAPPPEMLDGIDLIVYDIQDIGVRYYTYIYTMVHALRVAARQGVGFMVLDRPNPLGGRLVEGNVVAPGFESFVGMLPLAIRHGMTAGEIAMMVDREEGLGAALEIVPAENWRRSWGYSQTGLPWVQPSPNMPTLDTVLVYPGTCLLEGTNLSEGRGTTRPFEVFGAPWVSGHDLAFHLNLQDLPGVRFRPTSFVPAFSKYAGETCEGVQIHVMDPAAYEPVRTGLVIIQALLGLYPEEFDWIAADPTGGAVSRGMPPFFDLLMGTDDVRRRLEEGEDVSRIVESWAPAREDFIRVRERYLIYGD